LMRPIRVACPTAGPAGTLVAWGAAAGQWGESAWCAAPLTLSRLGLLAGIIRALDRALAAAWSGRAAGASV